jgi:hypothetical protein
VNRATIPLFTRLSRYIDVRGLFDCWLWTGATRPTRRGKRGLIKEGRRGSRSLDSVRVTCTIFHGPAPTPQHEAGHTCPGGENELCHNPAHLQWMTRHENEYWKHHGEAPPPFNAEDLTL